jgi:hypothetical protein
MVYLNRAIDETEHQFIIHIHSQRHDCHPTNTISLIHCHTLNQTKILHVTVIHTFEQTRCFVSCFEIAPPSSIQLLRHIVTVSTHILFYVISDHSFIMETHCCTIDYHVVNLKLDTVLCLTLSNLRREEPHRASSHEMIVVWVVYFE